MSSSAALAADPAAIAAPSIAQVQPDTELGNPAILARAEKLVERVRISLVLRGRADPYEDDGDRFDRFIAYFRKLADGVEDEAEWSEIVVPFVFDYGQSLDWLFDGDPATYIGRCAANSRRVAASDPIFAAIEKHRAAWVAWVASFSVEDGEKRLAAAEVRAVKALARTKPTTKAGVLALVQYVAECEVSGENEITQAYIERRGGGPVFAKSLWKTLAEVLPRLAKAA